MAKSTRGQNKITNYEGAKAYKIGPEMKLYTTVCTSTLSPKFYDGSDQTIRIRNLVERVDAEFVANLAVYARTQMYMRSVPLVLLVELARIGKLQSETVQAVVQRTDEIIELLGYYQIANDRIGTKKLNNLSKAIQIGIKRIFEIGQFDEYQYAKYSRKTDITFKDVVFLSHPKPNAIIQKIVDGTLEMPYTWETQLSGRGNTKEVWEELIDSKKIGYMATLRNLCNIINAGVSPEHIGSVCTHLANQKAVEKSKQLPFRFLSAYRELQNIPKGLAPVILEALEEAIKISVANIEGFDYNTRVLIACDTSGSMRTPVSKKSSIKYYDVGLVLGMLLQSRCKNVVNGIFANYWKTIQLPRTQILANTNTLRNYIGQVGCSTNGYKVLKWAIQEQQIYDKIFMFTDCQLWDSSFWCANQRLSDFWPQYKEIAPNCKFYMFDMAGYGHSPLDIISNDVYLISGWSSKIFNVLHLLEQGSDIIEKLKRSWHYETWRV